MLLVKSLLSISKFFALLNIDPFTLWTSSRVSKVFLHNYVQMRLEAFLSNYLFSFKVISNFINVSIPFSISLLVKERSVRHLYTVVHARFAVQSLPFEVTY